MSRRLVAAIAAAAMAIAGLLGWVVWQDQPGPDGLVPEHVTADGTGLVSGDGPVPVAIWLDFHCPPCRDFEEQLAPTLNQLLADGEITLVRHPVALLDDRSSDDYSTRAAGAAGCAADQSAHPQFIPELLDAQPLPGEDGLSDAEIIAVGEAVGLDDPGFVRCVRDGQYRSWVGQVTGAAERAGVTEVPSIQVAGEPVTPTVSALTQAVQSAAAAG